MRPLTPSKGYPDPFLTANLYCRGCLDALIHQVIHPFWLETAPQREGRGAYLWILRYGRGGEHLKVRVHGPESLRPALRTSLEAKADLFFTRSQALSGTPSAPGQSLAPPIDLEDLDPEHPDRTLLWTTYQRSPIVLGAPPLSGDTRYVAFFTRCLGLGCEAVLSSFRSGPPLPGRRQATLWSLVASGVSALWPDLEDRVRYLTYHRDWLIRTPVLRMRLGTRKAREILARYDTAAAGLDLKRQAALQSLLQRRTDPAAEGSGKAQGSWLQSLLDLHDDMGRFVGKPEYSIDPLAIGPVYPVVFKVFHGLANQLGMSPLNEGLAYHLMLYALDPERQESFSLIPE